MPPKAIPTKTISISQFNELTERVAELENLLSATVLEKQQAEEAKQQAEDGKQAAIEEAVRRTLEETKRQDASQLTTSPSHFKFSDINTLRTTKFNDHNWLSWSKETKMILSYQNLWDGVIISVNPSAPDFGRKNLQACLIITSGLEPHIVSQVRSFESAKDMWEFLRPKDCVHSIYVKRQELLQISIDNFKSVSLYLGTAKDLYDEINTMTSTKMPESDFVQILVNGLRTAKGNAYHRLIERMDERYREGHHDVYTFQWFRSELMAKERFVENHFRYSSHQTQSNLQSDSTAFLADEPEVICFKCDQPGHKANVCPQRKKPVRGGAGTKGKGRRPISLLAYATETTTVTHSSLDSFCIDLDNTENNLGEYQEVDPSPAACNDSSTQEHEGLVEVWDPLSCEHQGMKSLEQIISKVMSDNVNVSEASPDDSNTSSSAQEENFGDEPCSAQPLQESHFVDIASQNEARFSTAGLSGSHGSINITQNAELVPLVSAVTVSSSCPSGEDSTIEIPLPTRDEEFSKFDFHGCLPEDHDFHLAGGISGRSSTSRVSAALIMSVSDDQKTSKSMISYRSRNDPHWSNQAEKHVISAGNATTGTHSNAHSIVTASHCGYVGCAHDYDYPLTLVLDSGCSDHMFDLPLECFSEVKTCRVRIDTGNGKVTATACGKLHLLWRTGDDAEEEILLNDVLLVPGLPLNLLSEIGRAHV